MKKSLGKMTAILSSLMLLATLAACGNQSTGGKETPAPAPGGSSSPTASTEPTAAPKTGITYPLEKPITITAYFSKPTNLQVDDFATTEYSKELEKRTNVHVDYIHPPAGDDGATFQLMVAARDLPDVIFGVFGGAAYPGGLNQAKEEGLIIPLTPYLEEYAPDYYKTMQSDPLIDKLSKVSGEYMDFRFVQPGTDTKALRGAVVRGDWLEELGLTLPETLEDWENVLKAFKEQKGAEAALGVMLNYNTGNTMQRVIAGAFGVRLNQFYVDSGVVKYAPLEAGYKEFLTLMNDWYKKGYIVADAPLKKQADVDADMVNGRSGAFEISSAGIVRIEQQGVKVDPKFNLVGTPSPVLEKGGTNRFMWVNQPSANQLSVAITSTNKQVVETVKWANYGYTEEGSLLNSLGFEGITYEVKDGKPQFTDFVMNNPDGLPFTTVLLNYARGGNGGPFNVHPNYYFAQDPYPQQQEAILQWSRFATDFQNNRPDVRLNSILPEETAERAQLLTPIETHVAEMYQKFIIGEEPLSNYDAFIAQLKTMGIEKVIQITQQAHDRFMQD